jgi:hypothetical protein
MTLTTNENIPRVIMFNGKVSKLKIGFKTKNSIVKARPPKRKVAKPPETFIPEIACEIKKIEKELNNTFLTNDFIL